MWRQAGFLGDEVFGQLAPLPLLLKQGNGFDTQGLGISIHLPLLQKKIVDSAFHYGEIVGVIQRNEKIRILIVEDDTPLAMMMAHVLSRAGCDVQVAHTGKKGLELAKEKKFALITLDIDLPDINGHKVCDDLKQRHLSRLTPIVFVSGQPTEENRQRSLEAGAVDFIAKPFSADEFVQRLLSHVGKTEEISILD